MKSYDEKPLWEEAESNLGTKTQNLTAQRIFWLTDQFAIHVLLVLLHSASPSLTC